MLFANFQAFRKKLRVMILNQNIATKTYIQKNIQLSILKKLFQGKQIPQCIIFQISRLVFKNPICFYSPVYLQVQKTMNLHAFPQQKHLFLSKLLRKFQILEKWKSIKISRDQINKIMELGTHYMNLILMHRNNSSNHLKTYDLDDMYKYVICSKTDKEQINQILNYSRKNKLNTKILIAFYHLITQNAIFFRIRNYSGIIIKNQKDKNDQMWSIQSLMNKLEEPELIEQQTIFIYEQVSKISNRGSQTILYNKKQTKIYDCFIEDQ